MKENDINRFGAFGEKRGAHLYPGAHSSFFFKFVNQPLSLALEIDFLLSGSLVAIIIELVSHLVPNDIAFRPETNLFHY
jgi:hypothetical protein